MAMVPDEYDELMEELYEWEGTIANVYEVAQWLVGLRPRLNELYREEGVMVWIGYGFNDGDDALTVNVEVR